MQVYADRGLETILEDAGFTEIELYASLLDPAKESHEGFQVTFSRNRSPERELSANSWESKINSCTDASLRAVVFYIWFKRLSPSGVYV